MRDRKAETTHRSNVSFQYGLSVFFTAAVVNVCPPSTVTTANGCGRVNCSERRKSDQRGEPSEVGGLQTDY